MPTFSIGEVVTLKSGSGQMTVTTVADDDTTTVTWMNYTEGVNSQGQGATLVLPAACFAPYTAPAQ